jgi:hypothetical protein
LNDLRAGDIARQPGRPVVHHTVVMSHWPPTSALACVQFVSTSLAMRSTGKPARSLSYNDNRYSIRSLLSRSVSLKSKKAL